tara:strand:+ start:20506 stop:21243 length:738 start_codon:yes stop_codon:yes gene_type:complete
MVFNRRIEIHAQSNGDIRAALEDDFHHFRVSLSYTGDVVTDVRGDALRFPYTACPAAATPLKALIGMRLSDVAHSVTRATDPRHQCTHMLDLAGLAIAAAARSSTTRVYEISVPMRVDERTAPTLFRDGTPYLQWLTIGTIIQEPERYRGIDLNKGMAGWAIANLSADEAEAALILRRCTIISRGREYDLDAIPHARVTGLCYAQQPERAEQASRMKGSTEDFTDRAATLCSGDQAWLAGEEGGN